MKNREFYIEHDSIPLHAKLDFPQTGSFCASGEERGERCPLVILLHGYTGHMEERHILGASDALTQIGCAVLRVELYGHGKSGGSFREHTLLKWMSEAMAVIDYARGLEFVTDLYLAGHSQGGLLAILAGAMKRDALRAVIALSPATMIPDGARSGSVLDMTFDPEHVPDVLHTSDGRVLSGNYVRAAQMVHVEPAIRAYRKKVLLVHGDADDTVPASCAVDAAAMYEDAQLEIIHGDTHCYDHHLDQVQDAIVRFMRPMVGNS